MGTVMVGSQAELLIEPVWNRNLERLRYLSETMLAFNRTSMESKPRVRARQTELGTTFNRTSMESKHMYPYQSHLSTIFF